MGACFGCCNPFRLERKHSQKSSRPVNVFEVQQSVHELLEMDKKPNSMSRVQEPAFFSSSSNSRSLRPNKLVFRNSNTAEEVLSPTDATMPLLQSDSVGDSCSQTGSQGWENMGASITPSSSVDLEWENEIGLTPPLNANEELRWVALTETTNASWQSSSPVSNGLEWDGDFTSVEISNFISNTQDLVANIEHQNVPD